MPPQNRLMAPQEIEHYGSIASDSTTVENNEGDPFLVSKEALSDPNGRHKFSRFSWGLQRFARKVALLFIYAVVIVYLCVLVRFFGSTMMVHIKKTFESILPPKHSETMPTLLSLRDNTDETFLYALDNPLYEELRGASFHYGLLHNSSPGSRKQVVKMQAHPLELHGWEPLVIQWNDKVKGHDIMALACSNKDEGQDITKVQHFDQLLEVGTVNQIQTTHRETLKEIKNRDQRIQQFNSIQDADNDNTWLIPKFPIQRFSTCHFILYQKKQVKNTGSGTDEQSSSDVQLHYLASSPAIHLTSVTSPFGIHLSGTSGPTEMAVSFSTGGAGTPVAIFGTENPPKDQRLTGKSTTYQASDLCQEPANVTEPGKFVDPGTLHTVTMQELKPNTTYYYQVGLQHGQGVTWSEVFSFLSPMVPGDPTSFVYLVYGDQGCPENGWGQGGAWTSAMTSREVPTIRAVHHFGDLSYARGAAHQWDAWLDMIQPFAARVPLHVAVGNHEYDYLSGGSEGKDPSGVENDNGFHPAWGNFGNDSGGECGVPTSKRFTMPSSDTSNGVFWYSHEFGSVHTLVLSSEHDMELGSPQYDWLVADLASVDRSVTPWVVVEMHRPLYESEKYWDNNAVGIGMRYEIENVLVDYQVDLVLSGHYHAYLRTCDGLVRNKCHQKGPMYITIGTAGARLDDGVLYDTDWAEHFIRHEYGYGRITVANASSLHFEFVRAGEESDESSGDILDHVWLQRNR